MTQPDDHRDLPPQRGEANGATAVRAHASNIGGRWFGWIFARSPTLADGLASRQDNFLLLRMVAACLVIYGHARAITGGTSPRDFIQRLGWGAYSGGIAVHLFFVISGFLVTGSYVRNPDPWRFAIARVMRIVPAYVICVLLMVFALGAIHTTLPLRDYFADPSTWSYITTNLQFGHLQQDLPGVFQDNPKLTIVNGALWTLATEVRMYGYVLVLGLIGLLSRRWLGNLAVGTLVVIGIVAASKLPGLADPSWVPFAAMFALGSLAYLNRAWIPSSGRLVVLLAIAAYVLRPTPLYRYALALALAAFVFWFAYRTPWRGYNKFGDYSYGTYLYGFAVQQTLAHHFPMLHSLVHAAIALPIAIGLGVASWTWVERPCVTLGQRLGQRFAMRRSTPAANAAR